MDSTCWKIIGIAGGLLSAVTAALIYYVKKCERLENALLAAEASAKQVLREFYERLLERARNK